MTDKTVNRATLAKYAALLGRASTTYALLQDYDRAAAPKPRIVMGNNSFRLESRAKDLRRGYVVAVRSNMGAGDPITVTVADVIDRDGLPAITYKDARGRPGWAYHSAVVSVIKPLTEARGR